MKLIELVNARTVEAMQKIKGIKITGAINAKLGYKLAKNYRIWEDVYNAFLKDHAEMQSKFPILSQPEPSKANPEYADYVEAAKILAAQTDIEVAEEIYVQKFYPLTMDELEQIIHSSIIIKYQDGSLHEATFEVEDFLAINWMIVDQEPE